MNYYFSLLGLVLFINFHASAVEQLSPKQFFLFVIHIYEQSKEKGILHGDPALIQAEHERAELLVKKLALVSKTGLQKYCFGSADDMKKTKKAISYFAEICTIPTSKSFIDWINPWIRLLPHISVGYTLLELRKTMSVMGYQK